MPTNQEAPGPAANRVERLTPNGSFQSDLMVPTLEAAIEPDHLSAACQYASWGWHVFPIRKIRPDGTCDCSNPTCTDAGKHPRTEHGWKEATTDPKQIEKWWRKHPEDGIGIACGPSQLLVVDVDPRHDGDLSWESFSAAHPQFDWEDTVQALTGGGGIHYYWCVPDGLEIRDRINFLPGVDIRARTGYVVAPPSRHRNGHGYHWEVSHHPEERPPAYAPAPLLEALTRKDAPALQRVPKNGHRVKPEALLDRYIPRGVPGQRNHIGLQLACQLRDNGYTEAEAWPVMQAYQQAVGAPGDEPYAEGEARRNLTSAYSRPPRSPWSETLTSTREKTSASGVEEGDADQEEEGTKSRRGPSQAQRLVELALSAGIELFHWEDDAYVTFPVNSHRATAGVKRQAFRRWLHLQFLEATEGVPGSQAMQDALNVLEAKAIHRGPAFPVYQRVAEHDGALYLDLGTDTWEMIRVTAAGWEVVDESPVRFVRSKGVRPLPMPVRGGRLHELRQFLNIDLDEDWQLIVAWVMAAIRAKGPYPILNLNGEQGAAKSTTTRMLRNTIDPHQLELRATPNGLDDLMVAAKHSHILAYENVSVIAPWLSDAYCSIATGAGMGSRQLYTDDEEVLFTAMRPIIINGIGDIITRPDLIDRTLFVSLPPIPEAERRTEAEVWAAFEEAHPRILGAILDGVARGLANLPGVKLDRLPRMADFAVWGTATQAVSGVEHSFMDAYNANRADANALAIEFSTVAQAVLRLMKDKPEWTGTASDLLDLLTVYASSEATHRKDWPGSPRGLSGQLKRLATNLRAERIEIRFYRQGHRGERMITIERSDPVA